MFSHRDFSGKGRSWVWCRHLEMPALRSQLWSLQETSVILPTASLKQMHPRSWQHPHSLLHLYARWPNLQHLCLCLRTFLAQSPLCHLWQARGLPSSSPAVLSQWLTDRSWGFSSLTQRYQWRWGDSEASIPHWLPEPQLGWNSHRP